MSKHIIEMMTNVRVWLAVIRQSPTRMLIKRQQSIDSASSEVKTHGEGGPWGVLRDPPGSSCFPKSVLNVLCLQISLCLLIWQVFPWSFVRATTQRVLIIPSTSCFIRWKNKSSWFFFSGPSGNPKIDWCKRYPETSSLEFYIWAWFWEGKNNKVVRGDWTSDLKGIMGAWKCYLVLFNQNSNNF